MRFFPRSKITQKNFDQAFNCARAEIQRISAELKKVGWHIAVGTSGSARAIRDVISAENEANDAITTPQMQKIVAQIIHARSIKKAKLAGLKSDRLEVFTGGLVIMMAAFAELNISRMVVTDAALRDGVLYDMIGRQLGDDMRSQTITDFQQRYHVDRVQAQRVADIADTIFTYLTSEYDAKQLSSWRQYLHWGALVHEIGLDIAHTAYHKHAAYILEQADMPGFSRKEQKILATLVLGHRGDLRKMVTYVHNPLLWLAILALRLAALFCRAHQSIALPANSQLHYDVKHKQLIIQISSQWLAHNSLTASALAQESVLWQKTGQKLRIEAVQP